MATTATRKSGITSTDLALIATFAAVIAACSILPALTVSGSSVPFTFQMFAIFLAGSVLGAVRGGLAVLLYLAVATAGVPIFSGGGAGPATWAGVTGGYLVAFPIAAFVVGAVASRVARTNLAAFTAVVAITAAVVTVAIVGPLGAAGMSIKLDVSYAKAWGFATPFFVFDIIKGVIAAVVAAAVHRAFPQLAAKR
jgi:biotin transport system substrate-specific component